MEGHGNNSCMPQPSFCGYGSLTPSSLHGKDVEDTACHVALHPLAKCSLMAPSGSLRLGLVVVHGKKAKASGNGGGGGVGGGGGCTVTGRRSMGGGGNPWWRWVRCAEAAVIEMAGEGTGGLGCRCWPLGLCGFVLKA
jgi:hypothetical protein